MVIKSRYLLQIDPRVNQEDISILPEPLQSDFYEVFIPILKIEPYNCQGFPCHVLKGKLKDYRALEVEWLGDSNAYRLVYRIYEKPSPKRVVIISFALHDPAYDRAKQRTDR